MNPWEHLVPELLTDLYELTMAASYFRESMEQEATFSLFVRGYPEHRSYFVAAGLEHLLEILPHYRFREDSLDFLKETGRFSNAFLDYLRDFRFTGTVRAIPEGRIFFVNEPILEITAPIIEGQLLETLIINVIQLETLIASKAARCVEAAGGRGIIDFGLRRTHGIDAGLKAARASYLSGFLGTSNVLAGKLYSIPIFGTMAHSYVTAFPTERDAFRAYAEAFPDNTVLLIDTYDTVSGARKAVEVARELDDRGKSLAGVRLDSGDLVGLSREVRRILDEAGFAGVRILASGNLDEFRIADLLEAGAAIDLFAVGTRMGVSADAPYFDIAYKLVEYGGRPVLKLSTGKKTWVGEKQVYRFRGEDGAMDHDELCLMSEPASGGEPLLEPVIEEGRVVRQAESLDAIRSRFEAERRRSLSVIGRSIPPLIIPFRSVPRSTRWRMRRKGRL
ncbi:MAG: nicotinate phosphoribosyltransferase [Syntrophobacteraceae bacterium]